MNRITLKNKLQILFYPMQNVHSVTVGLYIRAGACYENKSNNGITHFLEHLHFRRLGDWSQNELYYRMESIGSTLKGFTFFDCMKFSMKIHPEYLKDCLEIFKMLITADEWSNNDLKNERNVVINQIEEKNDYVYAETIAKQLVFKGMDIPIEIMGTYENINTFTEEQIRKYKREIFNSENMVLCVTGRVSENDKQTIISCLQDIDINIGERKKMSFIPLKAFERKNSYSAVTLNDNMIDVHLSFDVDRECVSTDMLSLLNCILGDGVGSLLQKSLREDLGFTANVYSDIDFYEDFAVLNIHYSVKKEFLKDSITAVVNILNSMKKDINRKNLDMSLPFLTKNMIFDEDDSEETNNKIAYLTFILGGSYDYPSFDSNPEKIIQNLTEIAKKIFITNNLSIVLIGNNRKITKKSIFEIISDLDCL